MTVVAATACTYPRDMATCSYTSAEGRKCRNPSEKPYCRHHTCPGCEKPKQSRSIACKDCLTDYKPTGADYRSTPAKQSDGADYRSADAVEHAPRKAATGAKPACWQKKMLLAQAEASRPATKHMQDVLTSFGVSGGERLAPSESSFHSKPPICALSSFCT